MPSERPGGTDMLKVRDLHAGYGKANVLHGVSFDVSAGECVALVGANGAGKSTTLKCVCGLVSVRGGSIEFEGRRIDGLPGHAIVRLGITMCPEGRQVFPDMSVRENLEMGAHVRRDRAQRSDLEAMMDLFPVLRARASQSAGTLSGGEQEMLAIARALMTAPRVLLLDEPSAGLSPLMVNDVFARVRSIADSGIAVLMVEQNVKAGLRIADRGLILVNGRAAHGGAAQALRDDPKVAQLYLGTMGRESAAGALHGPGAGRAP